MNTRIIWVSITAVLLFALTGCSGGDGASSGGTSTVSGVAATGAPIVGTVTLKDKSGAIRGPVSTDSNGNFSIDVSGLSAPFILKAEWGLAPDTLFSVATTSGMANITPITHLALQLAANSNPADVFGGRDTIPDTTQINATTISAAQEKIRLLLSPLLTKYGIASFDPISGAYSATPENRRS